MNRILQALRGLKPNRVAAVLGSVAAIAGAIAPAVANLDLSSSAGVLAGVVTIGAIVLKFLDGSQKSEALQPKPRASRAKSAKR